MFGAFKERRPWAVAIIGLFFGPLFVMLYLGRIRIAALYFLFGIAISPFVLFVAFPWVVAHGFGGELLLSSPFNVIGAFHGWLLASKRSAGEALPIYARLYSLIAIWLALTIFVLMTALLVRTYFYRPFDAPSASMEPNINIKDYFLVSRRAFGGTSPQRGDIVVFRGVDGDYVKRIVGLPGDRVQMRIGKLVLNGRVVPQRQIEDFTEIDEYGISRKIHQSLEVLPSGRAYRVLDLGNGVEDNTEEFVVPFEHYFVLGDNRDNSDDSRISKGYIARRDILGKVVIKFADRQHKTMIWEPVN